MNYLENMSIKNAYSIFLYKCRIFIFALKIINKPHAQREKRRKSWNDADVDNNTYYGYMIWGKRFYNDENFG